MNRRDFLKGLLGGLVGGVAAVEAVRTWPFRVYSFPQEIFVPKPIPVVLYDAGVEQAYIVNYVRDQLTKLGETVFLRPSPPVRYQWPAHFGWNME